MSAERTARMAALNDALRSRVGAPVFLGPGAPRLGTVLMTLGIMSQTPETILEIWRCVRTFDRFEPGNDPYVERDFGAFDVPGAGRIFWKIDYYADAACDAGAEDPADPDRSFRVLTIMLAEEY